MAKQLEGKTALVTGASTGIGKGIALELAAQGCDVAVNTNDDTKGAEKTVEELRAQGRRASAVFADVSVADQVNRMFDEVLEKFGKLDILVNNAGIQTWKSLIDLEESEWDRVIDVNLKGCYLCTRRAALH